MDNSADTQPYGFDSPEQWVPIKVLPQERNNNVVSAFDVRQQLRMQSTATSGFGIPKESRVFIDRQRPKTRNQGRR